MLDVQTQAETEHEQPQYAPPNHVLLGVLKNTANAQLPEVSFVYQGKTFTLAAQAACAVQAEDLGKQVALSFIGGELRRPIVIGLVYSPLSQMLEDFELQPAAEANRADQQNPVCVDGKNVVLSGSESVELKCGEASITLTKAGKILIRGKYLVNRATGLNRIIGGSVQVN